LVKLSCEHEVAKNYLVKYTLKLFIQKKPYGYSCLCEICKKAQKVKNLPLSCGCIWTMFGEKIKYNNDLTGANYGKCHKDHPLTSIDLGLVNNFISSKLTSLMITDYPQEKGNLVNLFNEVVAKESLKDIAWILKCTKAVTKLNLKWKDIEDEDARAIGEALKINTTVTELDLCGNKIEDEGAKAIGNALKANTTLTRLDLYSNKIGDEGAKVIGEALKTNTTLTKLCLSQNKIGDEGAKVIAEALKVNTTLKELKLLLNKLGAEGNELMKEAKENHKYIEIGY